jgi:hypothetical protein
MSFGLCLYDMIWQISHGSQVTLSWVHDASPETPGQQHSDGKGQGSQREREERIRIFVLDMLFRVHSTRSRLGPSRGGPARIWWICGSGWAAWKRWVMCLHPAAWVSHKLWEYGKVMWSLIVWVMNFMNQSILKVAVWFVIFSWHFYFFTPPGHRHSQLM